MSTCIPYAAGIWNMGGPPNWGITGVTTRVVDKINDPSQPDAIKDPRWRGAVNQSFGLGTAEDASFRALWFQDAAGKQYIYFSWHVKFDTAPSSTIDRVYAVIAPSAGGGSRPLVLEIQPFNDTADHTTATLPANMFAGRRRDTADPMDPTGKPVGSSEALTNWPDWLNETRAWRRGAASTQGEWAIHMRVPIDPMATDVDGNNGLRLTTSFNMWYEFRIAETVRAGGSSTGISSGGVLRLNIPNGITLTGGGIVYPDPNAAGSGEAYTYGSVGGINDVSCAVTSGISLGYLDIGTDNSPTSYINPGAMNTFWAKPTNNHPSTDVPAQTINATFRLANWGSSRLDATWPAIRSGVSNSGLIMHGTQATPANDIRFNMDGAAVISIIPKVSEEPHQCMLVELSGSAGGLPFTTTSACRNMDFVLNSKDVRPAEISVVGLTPIDTRPRDVYLAVETLNMPENEPAGYSEGRFLETTIERIIKKDPGVDEKSLGNRLKGLANELEKHGDHSSAEKLSQILNDLQVYFATLQYRDPEKGLARLGELIKSLNVWLTAVKRDDKAARQLAKLMEAFAAWLSSTRAIDTIQKLTAFIDALNKWFLTIGEDPATQEYGPTVVRALQNWLTTLSESEGSVGRLGEVISAFERWLESGRSPDQLPALLKALKDWLTSLDAAGSAKTRAKLAQFARDITNWLHGAERLNSLVQGLVNIGITDAEMEQIFPTYRVHVYYDTGETWTVNGVTYPILELQPSFGFYAYHEGELLGFNHQLRGAIRVAENFYVLRVPNNGSTKITTIIHGIAPGEESEIEPEEPIKEWPKKPESRPCAYNPSDPWWLRLLKAICRFFYWLFDLLRGKA